MGKRPFDLHGWGKAGAVPEREERLKSHRFRLGAGRHLNEARDTQAAGALLLRFRILLHLADIDLGDRIPVHFERPVENVFLFGRRLGGRPGVESGKEVRGEGVVLQRPVIGELKPLGAAGGRE